MRWTVLVLAAAIALAGCGGKGAIGVPGSIVDKDSFKLDAGKGAIDGLLVDDRFRPIDLEDDPQTESQFRGSILLQELALESQTNENGEFQFLNIPPGVYTMRAQIDGHEASPKTVQVLVGLFAEADVLARRTATGNEIIMSEEFTAFIGCQASFVLATQQCSDVIVDLSGDSSRDDFRIDYSKEDARWVVAELVSNRDADKDGALKAIIRSTTISTNYYLNKAITSGDYMKVWLQKTAESPHDDEDRNHAWHNNEPMDVQVWAQGLLKEETRPAAQIFCTAAPICAGENPESRGIGTQLGVVVRFNVAIFMYDPGTSFIEDWCAVCPA